MKLALGSGVAIAAASLGCGGKRQHTTTAHPRYWVQILLSGGHDTLYTTDPKSTPEVDSMVSLPSDPRVVTTGAGTGEIRLGPHFAPLARWGSELTVLNGVQVRTVNHDTGHKQFTHLKTNIVDGMPTALDLIATHRTGQPLGVAYLNLSSRIMHSPAYFGTADAFYFGKGDIFEQVARSSPDELAALAKALRRQASDLSRSSPGWREAEQSARYLGEVADFFEQVAVVPRMEIAESSADYVAQTMSESFDRALWLLEHDLCCGVVVDLGLLGWDSHVRNETKQAEMNGHFVQFFDDYMAALRARKNRHGVLADRTVTIVGSELGRFPHQNDMLGKDHLPQTSFLMAGPGIRPGKSFGKTGRRMEGLPISYKTGEAGAAGRVPFLDDLGATMLHLGGLDPERYGYSGRICDFLLHGTS
ncbi:MAG: DUF1501 domain-containing protein [Deltaproteobacteria bacterium]|nr:DUF1501 domain-containing protein [Deltaproteobacteria bacterium]MDQ3299326.1 DUF1501 domain-containing protein [Myxococcota bacterium]